MHRISSNWGPLKMDINPWTSLNETSYPMLPHPAIHHLFAETNTNRGMRNMFKHTHMNFCRLCGKCKSQAARATTSSTRADKLPGSPLGCVLQKTIPRSISGANTRRIHKVLINHRSLFKVVITFSGILHIIAITHEAKRI